MLTTPIKKKSYHRKPKTKRFELHEDYLNRIAKSLYYVHLPISNCTSLPVTELAAEIFSKSNKFSLNRLDIEKAAQYTRNGCISPCLLVLALLYLERLKTSNPKYLTKVSPTELFLISLLVGSKFLQDDGEEDELNNTVWAKLTGFSVQEINNAEREFLDAINWNVYVSENEFWRRFNVLESTVGMKQGSKRGWFTYTELNALLQLVDLSNIVQCFWNVTSACMLSYTASVLALVGSALLVGQIPGLKIKPKMPTTNVDNWTSTSPSVLSENPLIHGDGNQDSNVSSLVESVTEANLTEPNFSKLPADLSLRFGREPEYSESRGLGESGHRSKDFNSNFFHRFYRHPSPSTSPLHMSASPFDFIDIDHLIRDKSKTGSDSVWTSSGNFNLWMWSDYIRTFLTRNTIPSGLHMVSSF